MTTLDSKDKVSLQEVSRSESPESPRMAPAALPRYLVREIVGLVLVGVLLFLPAGRLDWPMGWVFVGLMVAWVTATALVLVRINPDLIRERTGPRKGGKSWDVAIMGVVGLLTLARLVVAGFDVRYGWTANISLPWQIAAALVAAAGYAFGVWAMAKNAYFSQIVRVQKERGHEVVTDGPYRFVRHPGYVGSILFELAAPLMLGSWWALIPGAVSGLLFLVRTALEDRTLREELPGYEAYARKVRFRLLPGVW